MRAVAIGARYLRSAAALLLSASALIPASVQASALVSIRIEAKSTSVEEVLGALNHEFHLQYKSSIKLDRQITGIYQGSLEHVLAKVLDGYNFILRTGDSGIEVSVLGTVAPANPAVAAGAPPTFPASLAASRHTAPPALQRPPASPLVAPPAATHVASSAVANLSSPQPSTQVVEQAMIVGPALAPPIPTELGHAPEMIPSTDAPPMPTSAASHVPEVNSPPAGSVPELISTISDAPVSASSMSAGPPKAAPISSPFDEFDLLKPVSAASGLQEQQISAASRRP
jgi:hypothetical protein